MEEDIDLDYTLAIAVRAAKNAGKVIRSFQEKEIATHRKEERDIVSEVDIEAENEIIGTLRKHYPHHYFSSEEAGKVKRENSLSNRYEWIIDPIDGTINFVSGLPFFSTSIALQRNGKILLGVILNHHSGEIYTSIAGRGSFLNGKKLRVSEKHDLGDCVFSFMLTSHYDEKQIESILRIVKRLAMVSRGLRLFVSQAIELAYIATGKMEGTVCIKSRGFSASAGVLLVREAGGMATDIQGYEFGNSSNSLLATNSVIHGELLEILEGSGSQKRHEMGGEIYG